MLGTTSKSAPFGTVRAVDLGISAIPDSNRPVENLATGDELVDRELEEILEARPSIVEGVDLVQGLIDQIARCPTCTELFLNTAKVVEHFQKCHADRLGPLAMMFQLGREANKASVPLTAVN